MATDSSPGRGPRPTGKPTAGAGSALGKMYGPLPLWGWLLVAGGAFYLYRKMTGSKSSSSSTSPLTAAQEAALAQSGAYPGAYGGVFVQPLQVSEGSTGSGPAPVDPTTGAPAPSGTFPAGLPTTQAHEIASVAALQGQLGAAQQKAAGGFGPWAHSQPAAVQTFLHQIANSPQSASLQSFLSQNMARKSLGLPYFTSAGLFNPNTGVTIPTASLSGLQGTRGGTELGAGYAPAWRAAGAGTLTQAGV